MTFGYTAGTYDPYHGDHAALFQIARSRCDHLTVGVSTDELVAEYKPEPTWLTYQERASVVRSVRWVDAVVPQANLDKFEAWQRLKFDVLFVGDDWYDTSSWSTYERKLSEVGVAVIYIPTPRAVSSTELKWRLRCRE